MKNNDIMVSICCITYNQVDYIGQAIESFLQQKTDFKYEILIHDDASTDGTINVLKEYQDKYPGLVKVIYEKENQYTYDPEIFANHLFPIANGRYIALNEGDDFWTDIRKLQLQVDFLESHNNCSLCVNSAYIVDGNNVRLKKTIRPMKKSGYLKIKNLIIKGGMYTPTNSMIFRRKDVEKLPDFYWNCNRDAKVGDYPLTLYLASIGRVYYFDKFMSAYRTNIKGSWSNNLKSGDAKNNLIQNNLKMNSMLNEFNIFCNHKYENIVDIAIESNLVNIEILKSNFKLIPHKYPKIFLRYSLKAKISIFLRGYFPCIYKIIKKML